MTRVVLDRKQVAGVLQEIATLLELKGENPFKSRAYSAAARTLESLEEELDVLISENRLGDFKGIGAALAEKITVLATTGALPYLEDLKRQVPAGLLEITQIPGLGPKRARALHESLGVASIEELAAACEEGKVASVAGFGRRTQDAILEGIAFLRRHVGYCLLSEADAAARALLERLREIPGVRRTAAAGSLRRRREVVRDIDLLASRTGRVRPEAIIERFVRADGVEKVIGAGETKASVLIAGGRQVDLRVVAAPEFAFALHYFTGSKAHNIAIRRRAQSMGYKINEYGLWKGKRRIACDGEEEIYARLGLPFIPPELREDEGEIESALEGTLPRLVERGDIRGVFHVHSTWSDGTDTLETMIRKATGLGYDYIGISDHSRSAVYAGGLSIDRLNRQREEIDELREKFRRIRILHGTEADILKDGSLDYPAAALSKLDFVIGSVHSHLTLDEQEQTSRVVKAIENPHFTMLGHPTGRLLLQREGFRVDLDRVIEATARAGKIIELNANPHRLDLDDKFCRRARRRGVKVSINPDAHSADGLEDIAYGVDTARRGWLEPSDVANSRGWEAIRNMIRKAS